MSGLLLILQSFISLKRFPRDLGFGDYRSADLISSLPFLVSASCEHSMIGRALQGVEEGAGRAGGKEREKSVGSVARVNEPRKTSERCNTFHLNDTLNSHRNGYRARGEIFIATH